MLEKVKKYAIERHQSVNHKYGTHDYSFHLNMVYETGVTFIHLVDKEYREDVLCACWGHDLIEDTRESYNDVLNKSNKRVANLVYALTNEKGRNRKERASDKYYSEMKETRYAVFIKLCDRIANITHSKNERSRMFETYKKENDNFVQKLYDPMFLEMFNWMNNLFYEDSFILQTSIDYAMNYEDVNTIYKRWNKENKFYEKLEEFIKDRANR